MIHTVLGPVPASEWGVTSSHDHLLSDSSRLRRDGIEPAPPGLDVSLEHLGYLRWNVLASADNLRLDDPELAARELAPAVAAGQRALIESSSWGLGPRHADLPAIARASGMAIVCAYGAYVPATLPAHVAERDEESLYADLRDALQLAVPGTAYRAGMLGIMGTTADLAPQEHRMLRAAGRAAAEAGAAVSVRLDPDRPRGTEVIAILAGEGLPADRVVFTNGDEFMDTAVWDELGSTGAVVEMCFGTESVHLGRVDNPSDRERLEFFVGFLRDHPGTRHVLGQSVWTKTQLRAYGGYGYAHLATRIVPELRRRGVDGARLEQMLIGEPARLLDRP